MVQVRIQIVHKFLVYHFGRSFKYESPYSLASLKEDDDCLVQKHLKVNFRQESLSEKGRNSFGVTGIISEKCLGWMSKPILWEEHHKQEG